MGIDDRTARGPLDGFRPDLEGLRAVAVVLVVLYHASVPGFSGGYVGVDVFFVLSGFLITGLLLREARRSGTISLPNFYARRARRLLPASALVLVITLVASVVMMPPLRVPDVSGDAAAAALYVSNIRFALQATDYLQAEAAPSPLLHFWSLGVEEQFYIFWPAIVLLVVRARGNLARRIGIAAAVIAAASLGLSLWLTVVNQPWAFFSLPTRAWELGLGALLAVGAGQLSRVPDRPAAIAAWVGLGMVVVSGVLMSTATPFPGVAALVPTLGSALFIAGGFRQSAIAPGRWLSTAVPRFLGRISYSLYLWHWPVLILPAVALDIRLPWWARGSLVLLAVALAAVTQVLVEDPLRHGRWIGSLPRRNLAMAGALSVIVATASIGIGVSATVVLGGTSTAAAAATTAAADERQLDDVLGSSTSNVRPAAETRDPGPSSTTASDGAPVVPPATLPPTRGGPVPSGLRPSLAAARDDKPITYDTGCHASLEDTVARICAYGDVGSPTTVVLLGDSHAASWFPAVERLTSERGWRLLNLTKSACGAFDLRRWNGIVKREYTECTAWRESALRLIEKERPALVLVAESRKGEIIGQAGVTPLTSVEGQAAWRAGAARSLERLGHAADHVVVIGDTPRSDYDVPVCLSDHQADILACATPFGRAVDTAWLAEEATAAAEHGATYVDPTPWVCPSDPCPPVLGKFMVLRDEHHLSTPFSSALAHRLSAALPALTAGP
jgi:peptidoglycan/LPS O-acetylase OafA/YrhL